MAKKRRLDVMLSSTSKDLPAHRKKAEDAASRSGFYVVKMENLPPMPQAEDAISVSMAMVEEAEVYVGIFGMRYGYIPKDERNPNNISITEMEYRRAKELGMPILILIMDDAHPAPDTSEMNAREAKKITDAFYERDPLGEEKLDLLKKELQANHLVGFFKNAEDVRAFLLQALQTPSLKTAADTYFEKREEEKEEDPEAHDKATTPQADIPYPPELYAYPPYSGQSAMFVGRRAELQSINDWSATTAPQPMMVIEAIGGMGKSALTWRWVQDRAVPFDGILWYSFYEGGADMRDFVCHALAYVLRKSPDSLKKMTVPQMLPKLVHALQNGRYLVVLDGLERVLVAYHRWDAAQMQDDDIQEDKDYRDCTNPRDDDVLRQLAVCEPSRVLITSRLMPNALTEGAQPLKTVKLLRLKGLSRKDAQLLWQKHGITWDDDGVMDGFTSQFGRHSLLLKILIDVIKKNRRANGNFQVWYVTYGKSINLYDDMKSKRHHILQFAYEGLSPEAQKLLSQMAALGNAIDIDTLNMFNPYINMPEFVPEPTELRMPTFYPEERKASLLADYEKNKQAHEESLQARATYEQSDDYTRAIHKFDALLQDLESRGLIWWHAEDGQYDLHPVVRGYAFSQLQDKTQTFDAIYDIFSTSERDTREQFESIAEMQNVIAMYNALIGADKYDAAAELFFGRMRLSLVDGGMGLYYKAYELLLPLFANGLDKLPIVSSKNLQIKMLNQMGLILNSLNRHSDELLVNINEVRINLEYGSNRFLRTSISNISKTFSDLNQLAQSLKARQFSLELATILNDSKSIAFAHYALMLSYRDLGQWKDFESSYNAFRQILPNPLFYLSARQIYAVSLIWQNEARKHIDDILEDCVKENRDIKDALTERYVALTYGILELRERDYARAINYFREAIRIGNKQGMRDTHAWSGLARAYALQGEMVSALRIIEDGVNDNGHASAVVYMVNGDNKEATEAALEFYTWSWAQGEPYVRRWALEQARSILEQLNVEEPQLPVWDESQYELFPHEARIRAYIDDLKANQDEV